MPSAVLSGNSWFCVKWHPNRNLQIKVKQSSSDFQPMKVIVQSGMLRGKINGLSRFVVLKVRVFNVKRVALSKSGWITWELFQHSNLHWEFWIKNSSKMPNLMSLFPDNILSDGGLLLREPICIQLMQNIISAHLLQVY